MGANKPRVFVSSTIRDFGDLRSALKYWLEELGLDVRMSEYVDFERSAEDGAFDSCFKAIVDCDYYILLVGGYKGSEFSNGVSVTQQEYRVAARLAQEGKIKPVILIRKEVMTALTERQTLIQHGIDPESIENVESRVLHDPQFVASLVEEIRKTEYEREGTEGRAGSMWYYQFNTFRDVVDSLRVNLRLHHSVHRQALLSNLSWEIKHNLSALSTKEETGQIYPHFLWLTPLRQTVKLSYHDEEPLVMSRKEARGVFEFDNFIWMGINALRTSALNAALLSGEFLEYSQQSSELLPSPIHVAMNLLLINIQRCMQLERLVDVRKTARSSFGQQIKDQLSSVSVSPQFLGALFSVYDTIENIVRLSLSLLRYIGDPTQPFQIPALNPTTPYVDQIAGIVASTFSEAEIEALAIKLLSSDPVAQGERSQ
jgi:Domain of unknown function (DUF4062)